MKNSCMRNINGTDSVALDLNRSFKHDVQRHSVLCTVLPDKVAYNPRINYVIA